MCLTLCDPMDYTVCGILQARILEWVAFPFSRGSSQPRDQTQVFCIVGRHLTVFPGEDALPSSQVRQTSLVAQMVKHLPTGQETWVRSLGQEDPLEKEMATQPVLLPG